MLGQLIGAVRESGQASEALLERLQEANSIRKRASHDKTSSASLQASALDTVTVGDSLQILNNLALVVNWYGQKRSQQAEAPANALPIFLSVGGPHRLDQQQFLQRLRYEMQQLGVALHSLKKDEFHDSKPFDQIAELMASCRAALVVGLDRSHGYAVFEREKSDGQNVYLDHYTPTPWNQIEGGMASSLRLPILILRERRLHPEGIFEAESHGHYIFPFDLRVEAKELSVGLRKYLAGWVQSIRSKVNAG
jgi:hypothetical protein